MEKPSEEDIRKRTHELWEQAGKPKNKGQYSLRCFPIAQPPREGPALVSFGAKVGQSKLIIRPD